MIKCVIIEDNEMAAIALIHMVSQIEQLSLQGYYLTAQSAKMNVDFAEIDLVFLDVDLPKVSGFDFMKSLEHTPEVVITTSQSDFAKDAFDINALDFILKPVKMHKVQRAISRYEKKYEPEVEPVTDSSVFVKVDSNLVNIKFQDLLYIEALGDYTGFQTTYKRCIVKSTLSSVENHIKKKNFVRVHRSFIVNVDCIDNVDDSSLVIEDKLIPVSRNNRSDLLKTLNILK